MYNIGNYITYNYKEWLITDKGSWGLRLERGCGIDYSVIVIPWDYLD